MRIVRKDEEPLKIIKRNQRNDNNNYSNNNMIMTKIEIKLYGSWQTDSYIIPQVIDNIIPCNEYGNIEIWDENQLFCPNGTIYINHHHAMKAAKLLQIPYVPAIIGFERQNGLFNIPKIGGIVIMTNNIDVLNDAIIMIDSIHVEQVINKKQEQINMKWYKLVKCLLTRQKLREMYGH
jgi:hypothetical protein